MQKRKSMLAGRWMLSTRQIVAAISCHCVLLYSAASTAEETVVTTAHNQPSVAPQQSLDERYLPCHFSLPAKGWVQEEGVIKLRRTGGDLESLHSKKEYRDFDLKFEWQVNSGGNSGIIYRAINGRGLEYQVVDDESRYATEKKWSSGAVYDLVTPTGKAACRPVGQWNSGRIVAIGNHIEHWLNGRKVIDYQLDGENWRRRLEASKYAALERSDFGNTTGPIILQNHGQKVRYRNMRIRELDAGQIAH